MNQPSASPARRRWRIEDAYAPVETGGGDGSIEIAGLDLGGS